MVSGGRAFPCSENLRSPGDAGRDSSQLAVLVELWGSFLAGEQSGDRGQDRLEVLASAEVASQGPPIFQMADASRTDRPERRVDLWWSGKHACHGGNMQIIAALDGGPIRSVFTHRPTRALDHTVGEPGASDIRGRAWVARIRLR